MKLAICGTLVASLISTTLLASSGSNPPEGPIPVITPAPSDSSNGASGDSDSSGSGGSSGSGSNSQVAARLLRLGEYLGYNLLVDPAKAQTGPAAGSTGPIATLLYFPNPLQATITAAISTFLGALIPSTASSAQANTSSSPTNIVNLTFPSPSDYNATTGADQSSSTGQNQQGQYQPDPVSQAVLNILMTPDDSYCDPTLTGADSSNSCGVVPKGQVMLNILGRLPSDKTDTTNNGVSSFFSYNYNQNFLSQLNSDTLITPLIYSTTSDNDNNSTSNPTGGLGAQNEAQQAANFIRYASSAVLPISTPVYTDFDNAMTQAISANDASAQQQYRNILATFLLGLRVYAAQNSVAIGNLYYIMSKRMPQGNANPPTSQALSEYTMATWRLTDSNSNSSAGSGANQQTPSTSNQTAWLTALNTASTGTVQKEIATLLAEINYQLYLSRQQQERLLLTESMLLVQNAKNSKPNANFSTGQQ